MTRLEVRGYLLLIELQPGGIKRDTQTPTGVHQTPPVLGERHRERERHRVRPAAHNQATSSTCHRYSLDVQKRTRTCSFIKVCSSVYTQKAETFMCADKSHKNFPLFPLLNTSPTTSHKRVAQAQESPKTRVWSSDTSCLCSDKLNGLRCVETRQEEQRITWPLPLKHTQPGNAESAASPPTNNYLTS